MSIGELSNLYRDNELDVHPEFQRIFRWNDGQKTRLIESILLGIPIPPIFVAQREDGVWDVIDGQQRLSTVFQFMGELKDEDGKPVPRLVLEKTKFLPSLLGKVWEKKDKKDEEFTREQRLYIKRAKIDVNIVLKESDDISKYELFMRLNTGGTPLSPQEVRNCLMIMAYPEMYKWILALSQVEDFAASVSLSDDKLLEQYPMELVTRFLLFRKLPDDALSSTKVGDIGEYLNDNLALIHGMSKEQKTIEERAFRGAFKLIFSELEGDAFRRFDESKDKHLGGFSISAFEAIALGLGYNMKADGSPPLVRDFKKKARAIWSNEAFTNYSGSGIRASTRIPKIVPMGRKLFAK
jgi:hypothetical protein